MSQFIDVCFEQMSLGEVVVSYKGSINADVIADTLSLVEVKLENSEVHNSIKKKLYNVLVEGLQNLYHHVDMPKELIPKDGAESNFGIFILNYLKTFVYRLGILLERIRLKLLKKKLIRLTRFRVRS
jgi:hypothetical protein